VTELASGECIVGELALAGRLHSQELRRWLAPLGIGERAAVLAFAPAEPRRVAPLLQDILARAGAHAVVAECEGLLCAMVDCPAEKSSGSREIGEPAARGAGAVAAGRGGARGGTADRLPLELAARARSELGEHFGGVRVAASRPAPTEALRRSFQEARCALEASGPANGRAPEVASYEDLGAVRMLLSLQDGDALAVYCEAVLGPVEAAEGRYGEELLRSVDAFIEHNGHWEHAARALYCHRHTLRYRVRRVEQLTGRDFSGARDRIEFWLALRGRELAGG
jgi:purine catabolism regulator